MDHCQKLFLVTVDLHVGHVGILNCTSYRPLVISIIRLMLKEFSNWVHCPYLWPSPLLQPTPAVRAAAFTLFGTLSRFGSGPSEGPFLEQIQTNFVSLLLHLNEADPVVIAVSYYWCFTCSIEELSNLYNVDLEIVLLSLSRLAKWPYRSLAH